MFVKFEVKMTTKAMHDFLLYHTYSHMSGLIGAVFGVVTLGLGIRMWGQGDYNAAMMMFMFSSLFLIVTPFSLKSKAKTQVKKTPMFQNPISYELNEEGITTSQGDARTSVKWSELNKAVATNKSIIIYITRVRAFIFPRTDLGEQYTAVVQMVSTHMPPAKVKFRSVR